MQWPFISRALYRNVLRQLAAERRRADGARDALELEHRENRRAERHWANMFQRRVGTFPLTDKPAVPVEPMEIRRPPTYDLGELAALEAEAVRLGYDKESARRLFMQEHPEIDVLM